MQQRHAIGVIGVIIALVAMLVSVSVQAALPAPCHEQDVATEPTAPPGALDQKGPASRLAPNLRRMHCAAQRIMELPTLEDRRPYEEMRQHAARTIEDLTSQLQLSTTAAEAEPISAFARAYYTFLRFNATIASEALLAETPDAIAAARALSDEKGQAAFAQVYAALQPMLTALKKAIPVYEGLQPNAFMTTWLVLGPMLVSQEPSHRPSADLQRQAFDTDLLAAYGGETNIAPQVGLELTIDDRKYAWELVRSESNIVNLIDLYGRNEFVIAYAWAEIEVPETTTVLLGIGSNDAVKVWLNGGLVHENWVFRAVHKDDDIVPVTLRKGKNQLLFKVQNDTYNWGFVCRALGRDHLPEPFVQAAGRGKLESLERLLSNGVDINARNAAGLTGLHSASIRGQSDAISFLLERGADTSIAMPRQEQLMDALFRDVIDDDAPGAAVLVARYGNILYQSGFGQASLEPQVPITPQTKFRIASITKQFTAAATLKLQEDGVLSVTDTLSKFLPDYPRGDEVTIHHLLTHTSGIHSYTSKPGFKDRAPYYIEPQDLINSFKDDPYDFDPGEHWLYNNSGYFLLGHIIEKVSGVSYADYLKRHLFVPLGMRSTGVHHKDRTLTHEASGYSYKRGQFHTTMKWDRSHAGGAGALYSTVGDLFRWNEAIWSGNILSEASLKAAFQPVTLNNGNLPHNVRYGYGWGIGKQRGLRVIAHNGGFDGFATRLARYPDQQFTVAILTNARPAPSDLNVTRLANAIAEFYLWEEMETLGATDKAVDASVYDAYVGQYAYAILTVTLQGDRVFAQLTGQPKVEIFAKSPTEFFWKVVDAEVEFVKNDAGEITHAIHRQGGEELRAPKLDNADDATDIVGRYAYSILTVTREGERLFAQLTQQQKFEIFPKSPSEFFWKMVDARIQFVKNDAGKVTHAIHRQRGEFEAPKIK